MILKLKRRPLIAASGCCAVSVVILAAWLLWKPTSPAAQPEVIAALSQRCQTAMLRDVCTVMKASAPQQSTGRLFIAGIGEVDAQAYAGLRAAGDTMCQELAQKCQANWMGQACRIGKVLYPDLVKSP